jgi:hypothetical protein
MRTMPFGSGTACSPLFGRSAESQFTDGIWSGRAFGDPPSYLTVPRFENKKSLCAFLLFQEA